MPTVTKLSYRSEGKGEQTYATLNPYKIGKTELLLMKPVLTGKPIIKDTRLAVEFIIDLLARGWSEAEILENYPGIVVEDIRSMSRLCQCDITYRKGLPTSDRIVA